MKLQLKKTVYECDFIWCAVNLLTKGEIVLPEDISDVTEHHFHNLTHLLPVCSIIPRKCKGPGHKSIFSNNNFCFSFPCEKQKVLLETVSTRCIGNKTTKERRILKSIPLKWDELRVQKRYDMFNFWTLTKTKWQATAVLLNQNGSNWDNADQGNCNKSAEL